MNRSLIQAVVLVIELALHVLKLMEKRKYHNKRRHRHEHKRGVQRG